MDNILGVEHNNFIKHGRLADDYAGTSSVPVRRIQKIKSIYDTLSHWDYADQQVLHLIQCANNVEAEKITTYTITM